MIVHDAANRVIHLRIGPDDCALRVPQLSDAQLQVDRHSERAAIAAATKAGLAPEMLACDPRSGILITRWIDEPVWTAAQARATTNIGHIAGLLRQLHRLPIPAGVRTLDLGELIRGYWNQINPPSQRTLPRDTHQLCSSCAPAPFPMHGSATTTCTPETSSARDLRRACSIGNTPASAPPCSTSPHTPSRTTSQHRSVTRCSNNTAHPMPQQTSHSSAACSIGSASYGSQHRA